MNSAPAQKEYLFVYGTLLPQFAPPQMARPVRRLRRVGRGDAQGRLYDLGKFPGAIFVRGSSMIHGEVFELPQDRTILDRLDAYEEFHPAHPGRSQFLRREWPVLWTGKLLTCWVYHYNRDLGSSPQIPCGDFALWRGR